MEDEPQPSELSGDTLYIHNAIREAREEGREISDPAARVIASLWHGGQASAFYSFSSTGAINMVGLSNELVQELMREENTELDLLELEEFLKYILMKGPRGPVENWHQLAKWDDGDWVVRTYPQEP